VGKAHRRRGGYSTPLGSTIRGLIAGRGSFLGGRERRTGLVHNPGSGSGCGSGCGCCYYRCRCCYCGRFLTRKTSAWVYPPFVFGALCERFCAARRVDSALPALLLGHPNWIS
jgi:hypothetical protein